MARGPFQYTKLLGAWANLILNAFFLIHNFLATLDSLSR